MIEFTQTTATVPPTNLQKLLYSRELIAALARQLVAGQVEGHIDMLSDFGADYRSFPEVDDCIQGAKESVKDYVEDLLTEFRDNLYAEIENTVIETKNVQFNKDGFVDADVSVTSKV